MLRDTADFYTLSDIVTMVKDFLSFLLKRKWIPVCALVFGCIVGAIFRYYQPPHYKGEVVFLLEESKQSGASGPSQINISLNNLMNSGAGVGNDNLLAILTSKKVVAEALLQPIPGDTARKMGDLYAGMMGLQDYSSAPAGLKDSVLHNLFEKVVKRSVKAERFNTRSSVFALTVDSYNNEFSRYFPSLLYENAIKTYTDSKTATARALINQFSLRLNDPNAKQRGDTTQWQAQLVAAQTSLEADKPVTELLAAPPEKLADARKSMTFMVLAFSIGAMFLSLLYMFLYFITRRLTNR